MSNKYEISTLADIAKLEQDQIERLCAELPRHFEYIKAMQDLINIAVDAVDGSLPDIVGERDVTELVMPLIWIDDGKQDINASFVDGDTDEEVFSFHVKKDNNND